MAHISVKRSTTQAEIEAALPPSVVSGSINAFNYLVPATTNEIDFVALCKAMEEENKSAYFTKNFKMKEQVLLNKTHCPSELKSEFHYIFVALNPVVGTLPVMANGQFAIRVNQNAEGVKESTSGFHYPAVDMRGISWTGSGSGDGGSVYSSYNCTIRLENCTLSSLNNGFEEQGFSDATYIDGLKTPSAPVTGWCYKAGSGDGKVLNNIQAYGCKGVSLKGGSGSGSFVSGVHEFTEATFKLIVPHVEGDGPEGAKPKEAILKFNGGDYVVDTGKLYTLTEPNRAAIEVNDTGRSYTHLTLIATKFSQRLDNPANPTKVAEPVGNLLGVAIKFVELSKKSVIRMIGCRGEVFQETSESNAGALSPIGMKFEVVNTAGLATVLTNRRVMLASTDTELSYNAITAGWEVLPIDRNVTTVGTRRFAQPVVNLSKYAVGSAQAKGAPTTRKAGKHFYAAHAVDDRGRNTQLSAEVETELVEGEVPVLNVYTGFPSRVILWHGTEKGVLTEWVEIISPLGNGALADMGNAIGGYEWATTSLPFKPTTEEAANNTVAGYVNLDSTGVAQSFGAGPATTGEWQKVGDIWTLPSGAVYVCVTAATANNGGTWFLIKPPPTTITATNATWPIPKGATVLRIKARGGGGGGGGGGTGTTAKKQSAGAGGAAGVGTDVLWTVTGTTLNVEIGAGGAGGASGATGGNTGTAGTGGSSTKVKTSGGTLIAKAEAGGGGQGGPVGEGEAVSMAYGGALASRRLSSIAGSGGSNGTASGAPVGFSGSGGSGGGNASATLGGKGGVAGNALEAVSAPAEGSAATTEGGEGESAAANSGAGGAGGGGGAWNGGSGSGAGGKGGAGGSGVVVIEVVC